MDTIRDIPITHKLNLLSMYSAGMIGPLRDSQTDYLNYCLLHNIASVVVKFAGGRSKRPLSYKELFPMQHKLSNVEEDINVKLERLLGD